MRSPAQFRGGSSGNEPAGAEELTAAEKGKNYPQRIGDHAMQQQYLDWLA